ncbi:mitochondrial 54s ribosomal protein l51 [Ophiostoma piceae UAMH 11346]|uniref:Large ribosomal subunit protein mL43 n=1 Tax=Ophiostoma piceae (strain UAMH 11346) TaxID=1262450 RepID=S3CBS7_OPHP1|nr:mitochondrial 54s ribosomal protein l51 [Ophiostoma piceae UAMH 11346]
MTIKALPKVSVGRNGLGAFILQCRKLDFHYCDWAGSSKGMNAFIKHRLKKFAAENPEIEFTVSPRPTRHPLIVGHFINGEVRMSNVRNLDPNQVQKEAEALRNATGEKDRKYTKAVSSINASVRGVWSPYHGNGLKI